MHLIRKCPGVVKYLDGETVYAFRGPVLYISYDNGLSWERRLKLPLHGFEQIQAGHPYLRRLFRSAVHHLIPLDELQFICLWKKTFFKLDIRDNTARRLNGVQGARPLALCRYKEKLFYGQYCNNPDRNPVSIYQSIDNGLTWEAVFTFSNIRHIHGIFLDPFYESLWVTTGDRDDEAALWITKDHFQTMDKIIGGSQKTRIVQPLFSPEAVFFASDAPQETNYIYRVDRQTKRVQPLQQIDGTVFFGFQDNCSLNFATVYEGSNPDHLPETAVWRSCDGRNWKKIWSAPKDLLPPKLFQYGQILFPGGKGLPNELWISPLSVSGDQHSFLLSEK